MNITLDGKLSIQLKHTHSHDEIMRSLKNTLYTQGKANICDVKVERVKDEEFYLDDDTKNNS
jgi:hypothetical protein